MSSVQIGGHWYRVLGEFPCRCGCGEIVVVSTHQRRKRYFSKACSARARVGMTIRVKQHNRVQLHLHAPEREHVSGPSWWEKASREEFYATAQERSAQMSASREGRWVQGMRGLVMSGLQS